MLWHWQPPAEPSDWDNEYDVKFTRIMPGEVPNRDNDWFELTNTGDEEISLTGWTIENKVDNPLDFNLQRIDYTSRRLSCID